MDSPRMEKQLSPTLLGASVAGLSKPPSLRALERKHARCARCGVALEAGDRVAPHEVGSNFVDWLMLAEPHSAVVCEGCATLSQAPHVKRITGRFGVGVVITEEGWWRAGKNVEIAHWLLHPPSHTRWVWARAVTKGQHVLWKAPVNLQARVYQIQAGDETMTIRNSALRDLIDATREWQRVTGKPYPMHLDFDAKPTVAARMQPVAEARGTPVEVLVRRATIGELWGLGKLVAAGMKGGKLPDFDRPELLPKPLF